MQAYYLIKGALTRILNENPYIYGSFYVCYTYFKLCRINYFLLILHIFYVYCLGKWCHYYYFFVWQQTLLFILLLLIYFFWGMTRRAAVTPAGECRINYRVFPSKKRHMDYQPLMIFGSCSCPFKITSNWTDTLFFFLEAYVAFFFFWIWTLEALLEAPQLMKILGCMWSWLRNLV